MKRLKSILGSVVILIACSGASHAEVYSFSRANCFPPGGIDLGNESISWDPFWFCRINPTSRRYLLS